jgi:hypothetical protein
MIVAVDFDGTLCDPDNILSGYRMGQPEPGAILATKEIVNMGHQIIIFTARAVQDPRVHKAVADWADYFNIPYSGITNIKSPHFECIIDNRALKYDKNWPLLVHRLRSLI